MINIALNQNRSIPGMAFNDIYVDANGQLVTVTNYDALIQLINNAIWTFLKECDFDNTLGINYYIILGQKTTNQNILIQQLKDNILALNNYMSTDDLLIYKIIDVLIVNLNLNPQTRNLNVNIYITTINNNTPLNISINRNI